MGRLPATSLRLVVRVSKRFGGEILWVSDSDPRIGPTFELREGLPQR